MASPRQEGYGEGMRIPSLASLTPRLFFASLLLGSACAVASLGSGCSSDESSGGANNDGGSSSGASGSSGTSGTSGSSGTSSSGGVQKGKVIVALQNVALPGAKVTVGSTSATSKDDGTYELGVPMGAPYLMTVEAEDHYKLYEQEFQPKLSPYDRGDTSLLPKSIANTLLSFLQGRDEKKAILIVRVAPVTPCDDEGGSTVSLDPPGASMVKYIKGGIPSNTADSVTKGESFSAVIYNIEPGAAIALKVTSPKCKQAAFPIDVGDVTYTGKNQKVEAGEVISFMRVFIKDLGGSGDASTD